MKRMNKLILIAHGELAKEMKQSAEMIFGVLNNVETISFLKEEGLESIQKKIVDTLDEQSDYLIFCDLFCGTPYNASCAVALTHLDRSIEVVSGMSLPLVLEAAHLITSISNSELATLLIAASKNVVQKFDKQILEEEEDF